MKKLFPLFVILLCCISCRNKSVSDIVKANVNSYSSVKTQKEFIKWLFEEGSDVIYITEDNVTYSIRRSYDPESYNVEVNTFIEDGVADYHMNEVVKKLENDIKETLKNESIVNSVYREYNWVVVVLKNDWNFNNYEGNE